ncbi:MAG TPA: hypothetical protein VGR76_07230, partial [Candidatus Angelobacter sp.]|nr:hypothetical protein [Candidatus Angelobacter sp.]
SIEARLDEYFQSLQAVVAPPHVPTLMFLQYTLVNFALVTFPCSTKAALVAIAVAREVIHGVG